jgi:hypothetical protein
MPPLFTHRLPLGPSLALALLGGLALMPSAALAGPGRCGGTLLQLQVEERGSAAFDRFRFDLGLEAEAASKDEAMGMLNQRLASLRVALRPLVPGELTIPAPSTYRSGGGPGASATPSREHASTSVGGVVSKASYDALIQTAARLPGVTLRGFSAEAAAGSEIQLQTVLLRKALAEGRRQAEVTAAALGLSKLNLLRIDQRGGATVRPMPYAMAAARNFTPEEAPAPERSLSLALDYCLF